MAKRIKLLPFKVVIAEESICIHGDCAGKNYRRLNKCKNLVLYQDEIYTHQILYECPASFSFHVLPTIQPGWWRKPEKTACPMQLRQSYVHIFFSCFEDHGAAKVLAISTFLHCKKSILSTAFNALYCKISLVLTCGILTNPVT